MEFSSIFFFITPLFATAFPDSSISREGERYFPRLLSFISDKFFLSSSSSSIRSSNSRVEDRSFLKIGSFLILLLIVGLSVPLKIFLRLILGLLVHYKNKVKLIGDKSLSKRDFSRVINPLKKFGATFKHKKNFSLPLEIYGVKNPKPIFYTENKGSAQCKSSIMLAALNTKGETIIKAKKSRNHTELLFKNLKIPITIKNKKNYDFIKIKGCKEFYGFNYNIPSDISSSAFFIVLTILSEKSKLIIKDVNINPSRIGLITILKKMGAKISYKNSKLYKGEKIADIHVKSTKNIKAINCPTYLNSQAIDEFLLIFLVAAKAKGVSTFKKLSELNQKESPRLKLGSKILNQMGVKTILTNSSIKIFGNPSLLVNNTIEIKNYLKDHRIFMMSMISALTMGGYWKLFDQESIKTSFPSFLKIIKQLKG